MPFDGNPELSRDQLMISKAQDILRRDGWITGTILASDGRKCVMGAITAVMMADGTSWFRDSHTQELDEAISNEAIKRAPALARHYRLNLSCHDSWALAASWNNVHAKDTAEVIDFLECVKERLNGG